MTSNGKRILTGVIEVPLLLALVLFLPHYHHLAFCIVVALLSILGSCEMHTILTRERNDLKLTLPSWLGVALPIAAYIEYSNVTYNTIILYVCIAGLSIVFLAETLTGQKDNFKYSRERIAYGVIQFLYPNLFAIFFIRLCFLPSAWMWLLTFFLLVFSSDTFAYFFGLWLGKGNKGIIKVSPNKSIAGFVAGALVPAIIGALLCILFAQYELNAIQGFVLGLFTAIAGIIGDLIESAFKRASGLKDSGTLIPGRGGVLDSIDSLLIACPVYMALIHLFQVTIQ